MSKLLLNHANNLKDVISTTSKTVQFTIDCYYSKKRNQQENKTKEFLIQVKATR